jgi:hypothetical protein
MRSNAYNLCYDGWLGFLQKQHEKMLFTGIENRIKSIEEILIQKREKRVVFALFHLFSPLHS